MPEDESSHIMILFEWASETGRISKLALQNWVVNDFREREAFALTLNDTRKAMHNLKQMLNCICFFLMAFLGLVIFEVSTTVRVLIIAPFAFMALFGGYYCNAVFEAIDFIFVKHRFDVGDLCVIDGVKMMVKEITILRMFFLTNDNLMRNYLNSELARKTIYNYGLNPRETVEFSVNMSKSTDKIVGMKQEIVRYVENQKEHWRSAPTFISIDLEENRMTIVVCLTHTLSYEAVEERWRRRGLLVEKLVRILCDQDIQHCILGVQASLPPLVQISHCRSSNQWSPSHIAYRRSSVRPRYKLAGKSRLVHQLFRTDTNNEEDDEDDLFVLEDYPKKSRLSIFKR